MGFPVSHLNIFGFLDDDDVKKVLPTISDEELSELNYSKMLM